MRQDDIYRIMAEMQQQGTSAAKTDLSSILGEIVTLQEALSLHAQAGTSTETQQQ